MACQNIDPVCTFKYIEAVNFWGTVPPPEVQKNVLGDATGEDDPMKKILGFTCTLGLGSSSSTLSIDLSGFHADAEDTVGRVATFKCDEFGFGGVIKSVVHSEDSNGQKTKIEMNDCKELIARYDLFLNEWHDTTDDVSRTINGSGGTNTNTFLTGWNCKNVHRLIEGDSWGEYIFSNRGQTYIGYNNYGEALPDMMQGGGGCSAFGTATDGKVAQGNTTYWRICNALVNDTIRYYNTKSYPLNIWIDKVRDIANEIPYVGTSAKSITLLDLINNVCEAAGYDWTFHTPEGGNKIVMKFIDKKQPTTFGEVKNRITAAKNSGENKLLNYSIGAEFKNEKTRRVVFGSKVDYVKEFYFPTSLQPGGIEFNNLYHRVGLFLGLDNNGDPIITKDVSNEPTTFDWCANVNTSSLEKSLEVAGYPGFGNFLQLCENEMLATSNLASWKLWGIMDSNSISGKCLSHLGIDTTFAKGKINNSGSDAHTRAQAAVEACKFTTKKTLPELIYEEICYAWIRNFYEKYYGKFYVCVLPKSTCYYDATGFMQNNGYFLGQGSAGFMADEPTDSGWGDGDLNNTIGLSDWTNYKDNSGKIRCFVRTSSNLQNNRSFGLGQGSLPFMTDPGKIQADFRVEGNYIYTDAEVDGRVFFTETQGYNAAQAVLIKVPNMIPQLWYDTTNKNLNTMGLRYLELAIGNMNGAVQYGGTTDFSFANVFKAAPLAAQIDAAAVPFRSKVVNYGSWLSHGRRSLWSDGGVELRHVEDLNPWTYGGTQPMDDAGYRIAQDGIKDRLRYESGSITIAETPQQNMEGGGAGGVDPVIDSIVCKFDSGGATTTYNYQTYVQKFGQSAEHFNAYVKSQVEGRRANANALKDNSLEITRAFSSAMRAYGSIRQRFYEQMSVPLSSSSASLNNVLILSYSDVPSYPGRIEAGIDKKYTSDYFQDQDNYSKYAIVSLDMIFSPISTAVTSGPGANMPGFTAALGSTDYPNNATKPRVPPTTATLGQLVDIYNLSLNPYTTAAQMGNFNGAGSGRGFYTEYIAFGSVPANTFAAGTAEESVREAQTVLRGAALRGPLMLHSWGYDTNGDPVPGGPSSFNGGWLGQPATWPVGPIDLRWDKRRGVWVSPPSASLVVAELTSDLNAYGSATANILPAGSLYNKPLTGQITVTDYIGQVISAGCKVVAYHYGKGAEYLVVNAGICLVKADAGGCEPSVGVGQPAVPEDKHLYGFGPNGRPAMYSIEELFKQPNLGGGSLKVLGYEELNDNGHPCMVEIDVIDCSGNDVGAPPPVDNVID